MMASVLVANLASNKYIILFQMICTIQDINYNYKKIGFKKNSII